MLWATNFAAPYRKPLWDALAAQTELTVVLTESHDSLNGAARGADWFQPDRAAAYRTFQLPTFGRSALGHPVTTGRLHAIRSLTRADVVVLGGWETPVYWQLDRVARRWGSTRIGFYESTLQSQTRHSGPIAEARRHFFRGLDAVVTPGPASSEALLTMGIPGDRILTGFNPVDVLAIQSAVREVRATDGASSSTQGHRFLYVGQLIERKNVVALVEAFDVVRAHGDTLTIVGDGPLVDDVQRVVENLGLGPFVTCDGPIAYSAVPAVLAAHHTLVLPSTQEVWGLVANEALSAGLHCVVSKHAGVAVSIADMEGAFVCDTSVEDLANAMSESRTAWRGWLESPAILKHTPQALADLFLEAAEAPGARQSPGESSRKHSILVVQPYLPAYREPLFEAVRERLDSIDVDFVVAAPAAPPGQRERGDDTAGQRWRLTTRSYSKKIGNIATFTWLGTTRMWRNYSVVIAPASATVIDSLQVLLPHRRPKIALWGHIDSYVRAGNRLDLAIEGRMLRCADAVLAYTDGGAAKAMAVGVDASKVFTLNNTVDTASISRALADPDQTDVVPIEWVRSKTFGYIGALDRVKETPFLSEVLDHLWRLDPEVRLVVAGRGADEHLLRPAEQRGQVKLLGYADAPLKANIGRRTRALLNPGRVGLNAVDALALGLPLITTTRQVGHGPELAYLTERSTLSIGPNNPEAMAHFLVNEFDLEPFEPRPPLLTDMVEQFVAVCLLLLSRPVRA